jgi:hypothetical protein
MQSDQVELVSATVDRITVHLASFQLNNKYDTSHFARIVQDIEPADKVALKIAQIIDQEAS